MDKMAAMGASLTAWALRRPVTVCMVFISMLLLGLMASKLLPLERFPAIDIPFIVVQVPYDNATPEEVEKMITKPVEEALATMSGITRMTSFSTENSANVQIEFAWDENLKAKSVEAREKIDGIRNELPNDVQRVQVFQFNTSDSPIFQLRVSSQRDLSNAYDLLERNLKMPMERVPGVSKVELYGVQKRQISIRINADRVAALHVDVAKLTKTLRDANFSMTSGHFYQQDEKITLKPQGQYRSVDDIRNLIISPGIRLRDVARVSMEKPEATEGRHLDQTYAVGFNIYRDSDANLVEVSKRVMKVVNAAKNNPAFNGINLYVMDDEAKSVTDSLDDLLNAGLLGALLSVLVLYAFLRNLTTTLIVVLSVPFSICITLACMYFMGYTLNILSMMGLMLAVGMLVDNAVVITESIYQEKVSNPDPLQSTIAGVGKVSLAVIAGTATTAIVFLPNIVGKKIQLTIFLEHVAISICISLFASLLIAQTLIPLLTSKIPFKPKQASPKTNRLYLRYQTMLAWTLKHQKATAAIGALILVSTIVPMQMVSGDDDNNDARKQIWMNYNMNSSYSLPEVEKTVKKVEAYLYANKAKFHIKQVYSYYNPGFAVSGITLVDDLPVPIADIKKHIMKDLPPLIRAKPSFKWNNGNGGGVKMTLLGQSTGTLMTLANQVSNVLKNVKGLTDVKPEIDDQKYELQIQVDRQKAYRFGLNVEDIATVVSTALRGVNLRTMRNTESGEVNIKLLFDKKLQHSLSRLKGMIIKRVGNQNITLDMVAHLTVAPRLSQINRYYRQTALSIGANLEKGTTISQARERIEQVMKNMQLPAGYSWTLDGSFRQQRQAQSVMVTNMILAVCMIYVVMAALFESLLLPTAVITSLLFSFTGVFWALMLTGTNMSIMAMIGMLILMGIVVNNGIVLVDRINQLLSEGWSITDAVLQGCMNRIRPILMTVATTVLGLLPLALGGTQVGGDGPPYAPMAIAIIGGLTFSTVTSLFLVPLAYILLLELRQKTRQMVKRSQLMVAKVIS